MDRDLIIEYKKELNEKYKELYEFRLKSLQENNDKLFDENQKLKELLSKTRFRGII